MYEDALNVGDLISAGQYLQDYEALYGSFYDAGEESASGMSEGVESKSADVSDAAAGLADDATQAVSDKKDDMQTAAEDLTQAGVDAITDMEPDMQDAGETLGMAAVDGTDSGMGDLSQVGDDSVDGLLSAINAREDDAYSAGKRIGGAFRRGYTTTMQIHSPSRVMAEAGEYTVEGLLDAFDEADDRVARAGSALAEAFSGGYNAQRAAYSPAGDAQGSGMGISASDIAEAVRGALDGMGLYFDGQRTGRVVAEGVSQQIATRSSATVSGQSASRKGW